VVTVAELPKGHTAKVQRLGLADKLGLIARDQVLGGTERPFVAPRTEMEEIVARIWAEVLGVKRVGIHDDFFHLGGDSLLAVQILSRVQQALGHKIDVLSYFETPTVMGLAAHLEAANRGTAASPATAIQPAPRDGPLPLSFAQEGLWFADQLNPGNPVNNNYRAVRLTGPLDHAVMQKAVDELVQRHEALRTTFPTVDGAPVQAIAATVSVPVTVLDAPQAARGQISPDEALLRADICRPFDLARGPLLRVSVFRLSDEEQVLLVVAHHIITDGWSMANLFTELATLYSSSREGGPAPLPPLTLQYVDFALWERQQLRGAGLQDLLSYWHEKLAGAPACLDLPTDRPRPAIQSFRGARQFRTLPEPLVRSAKALSRKHDVTLFMTLLAAFKALLHCYTGQADIVVGSHFARRDRVETEGLVGDFTNTLALRTQISGDISFQELLTRVRATALEAYAHQDLPFGKLLEAVRPARRPGRTPLFQVKFRLQNVPAPRLGFAGLSAQPFRVDYGLLKVDLGLELAEGPGGLGGFIEHNTDLFAASSIEQMWTDFETLLGAAAEEPTRPLTSLEAFRAISRRKRDLEKTPSAPPTLGLKGARRKVVDVSATSLVRTSELAPGQPFPCVVQPAVADVDLAGWVQANRSFLGQKLLERGGVLFRGFAVKTVAQFEGCARALSEELLDYTYRSTPRSQVSGNVYTSTEFPADQEIPLHNEMSYASSWPRKIWFCCLKAAEQGGETPLADSRKVHARIRPEIRERFRLLGVKYVRVFGEGLDLHWHNAFQTTERGLVEEHCRRAGIELQWLGKDRLRTSQVCQAITIHPQTGETVWFNQAHLFHVSSLKPELRDALLAELGEEQLPRNAYYGDGSPIELDVLDEIRAAYAHESVAFPWQPGDVVLLDNILAAHGRRPFRGARKVVVAMAEACTENVP
jgi:alpha-ketoglutarate-dependent taurine dioxygenase/acyl carrier protein